MKTGGINETENMLYLLNSAKNLEDSRYRLYRRNSAKVLNPEGKQALIFLADVEKKHLALLKKKIKEIRIGKSLENSRLKANLPSLIKVSSRKFREGIRELTGDINIMMMAVELERQDVYFYQNLISLAKEKNTRGLFAFLLEEEKIHRDFIGKKLVDLQKLSAAISSYGSGIPFPA